MSESNNLPWILVNIDMLLSDKQMLKKMLEIFRTNRCESNRKYPNSKFIHSHQKKYKYNPQPLQHFFPFNGERTKNSSSFPLFAKSLQSFSGN